MPSQIGAFALARCERPPRSAFIRLFFLAGRAQRQELGSFGSRSPRAPCLQVAVAADGLVTAQVALGSGQIVVEARGVRSAPVLVSVARPALGVLLINDIQLVGSPAAVDPGPSPASTTRTKCC